MNGKNRRVKLAEITRFTLASNRDRNRLELIIITCSSHLGLDFVRL